MAIAAAKIANDSISLPALVLPEATDEGFDAIIDEGRDRFKHCAEYEAQSRQNFLDDLRISDADDINGYQWPSALREARTNNAKPALTVNIIRQHNLQIINEARKNKASIKVIPMGGDASVEAAKVWKQLIRHIEYVSNAQDIYAHAVTSQVKAGIGWWRIVTNYANDRSMDQMIFIEPVADALSVYIDPDCKKPDKSDANYAFVFGQIPPEDFKTSFPQYADLNLATSQAPLGASSVGDVGTWGKDMIWFAEYFRKVARRSRLINFSWQWKRWTVREDEVPREVLNELLADPTTRYRETKIEEIEWYLIVGQTVIDHTIWLGKYIPLIPVIGEELVVDGVMDRKGHTRNLRDAQRMFNYNISAQTELVADQTKTPWIAAAKAIEGNEPQWNAANRTTNAVLVYNNRDDEGNEIPKPERVTPPVHSQAHEIGMTNAFNWMMQASGQYQNQMGMMGNERTGAAIKARQGQSDNSVAHFQENLASALRLTGRQLIDLIPKILNTPRVIRVMDDDGSDLLIRLDPGAAQALQMKLDNQGKVVERVLNPTIGEFDVAEDVGPSYGSARQETLDALHTVMAENPALAGIIGDIYLKNLDIDDAMEAALRLKRMVPPQALGQGPSPAEQQLQAQLVQTQMKLEKALGLAARDRVKLVGKTEKRDIEAYSAETQRMTAINKFLPLDQSGLEQLVSQLVKDALQTHLSDMTSQNEGNEDLANSIEPPTSLAPSTGNSAGYIARNPKSVARGLRLMPLVLPAREPGMGGGGG